jgi:glycosyltransferase involved in cell wall biosynthesis
VSGRPDISVIIPAYNEENYLNDTIAALRTDIEHARQSRNAQVEIVVVDDGSVDKTFEIAQQLADTVVYGPRGGIGLARNAGAAKAAAPLLVFLDADALVEEGVLGRIYDSWRSGAKVGAVVPIYRSSRPGVRALLKLWGWCAPRFGTTQGVCQFVDNAMFQELGGYSPDLRMAEDSEFYVRATQAMAKAGQGNGATCIHDVRVWPSMRRYDHWSAARLWFWMNPLTARLFRRSSWFWRHWYIDPPR